MSEERLAAEVGRARPSTVVDHLGAWADEIIKALPALSVGELVDSRGTWVLSVTPFCWSELPVDVHPHQSFVREEYLRFCGVLRVLLREQPKERVGRLEEQYERVLELVDRQATSRSAADDVLEAATAAIRHQVELLGSLYSAAEGTLLVVDTNALYWNPALEDWRASWGGGGNFTIVLTPTVVREIDQHKVDERQPARRAKAERLERQIGEYRRRGRLLKGVPLVNGISTIMAVALEPRMSESLPWLDADSADDRLLASVLEVMRQNPRARVTAVTRDLNFQNKLEFARIPFLTPADLVTASPATVR